TQQYPSILDDGVTAARPVPPPGVPVAIVHPTEYSGTWPICFFGLSWLRFLLAPWHLLLSSGLVWSRYHFLFCLLLASLLASHSSIFLYFHAHARTKINCKLYMYHALWSRICIVLG
ncbi:hypothetical protein B0H14DRAFT_3048066, partial [Mycena olivaceomarginata]